MKSMIVYMQNDDNNSIYRIIMCIYYMQNNDRDSKWWRGECGLESWVDVLDTGFRGFVVDFVVLYVRGRFIFWGV